jgi:hypothetical protein
MFPNNTKYLADLAIQGPQIKWHSTSLAYSEIKMNISLNSFVLHGYKFLQLYETKTEETWE